VCGTFFWSLTSLLRRGWGQCCTKACANKNRKPYGPRTALAETFWQRVKVGPECWGWLGFTDRNGYGRIGKPGTQRSLFAHRVSWELHHGALKKGQMVCHRCDNPPCTNPAHLFLGSQADNLADMRQKGREARGERIPSSKLTEAQVIDIRLRYRSGGVLQRELAAEYGVSQPTITDLLAGRTWKHVR
jgi:hypothetical protein